MPDKARKQKLKNLKCPKEVTFRSVPRIFNVFANRTCYNIIACVEPNSRSCKNRCIVVTVILPINFANAGIKNPVGCDIGIEIRSVGTLCYSIKIQIGHIETSIISKNRRHYVQPLEVFFRTSGVAVVAQWQSAHKLLLLF